LAGPTFCVKYVFRLLKAVASLGSTHAGITVLVAAGGQPRRILLKTSVDLGRKKFDKSSFLRPGTGFLSGWHPEECLPTNNSLAYRNALRQGGLVAKPMIRNKLFAALVRRADLSRR
jgi:hypothetical protein